MELIQIILFLAIGLFVVVGIPLIIFFVLRHRKKKKKFNHIKSKLVEKAYCMNELDTMLENDLITQEEYDQKKAEIIERSKR